jgi:hypothetical protein
MILPCFNHLRKFCALLSLTSRLSLPELTLHALECLDDGVTTCRKSFSLLLA